MDDNLKHLTTLDIVIMSERADLYTNNEFNVLSNKSSKRNTYREFVAYWIGIESESFEGIDPVSDRHEVEYMALEIDCADLLRIRALHPRPTLMEKEQGDETQPQEHPPCI